MFISGAELFRIQTELRSLALRVDLLREDLAGKESKRDESKWADAIDADLRAEIALLAEALGYVREVGGPKYRKEHALASLYAENPNLFAERKGKSEMGFRDEIKQLADALGYEYSLPWGRYQKKDTKD